MGVGMITVYGTVCLDRLCRVERLPPLGGYAEIVSEDIFLGGEGANTTVALRRWGMDVRLVGNTLGNDAHGHLLRTKLNAEKIGDHGLAEGDIQTPRTDIFVTPDGERTMFGLGFRNMYLHSPVEFFETSPGAWFTVDPNHGEAARRAAVRARKAGMRVYLLDFVGDDEPIDESSVWQSSTDWVGYRGNTQRNVQWVTDWVDRYRCLAILSDGPNGFVAGSPSLPPRHYPPYPCPLLMDSTGAGDVFRAGMLFGLAQGWDLADCFRFASAAGCLNCRGLGATSAVPDRSEIEHFVKAHNNIGSHY